MRETRDVRTLAGEPQLGKLKRQDYIDVDDDKLIKQTEELQPLQEQLIVSRKHTRGRHGGSGQDIVKTPDNDSTVTDSSENSSRRRQTATQQLNSDSSNNNNNNYINDITNKTPLQSKDADGDLYVKDEALQTSEAMRVDTEFKAQWVWRNIILFVILHSSLPIGLYLIYTQQVKWPTLIYSVLGMYASGLGVTGGSHRLWSHKSYKAKWPVQVVLMLLQTMAGQNSIYTWSRDHRVHHKFSETNADPHNIKRGFFFAHMGWLCCRKHPEVIAKGKLIDMSDLEANAVVMFQHRHFWWLSVMFTVLVPSYIPVLLWGEKFWSSFIFSFMVRYMITLHGTWLVNSAAHYYGHRPYDVRIEARESPYVIYNALGEGFHNYHHTFPYDYAAGEFGKYLNITTTFIDMCASLGLVYGRRKVDADTVRRRRERTGNLNESLIEESVVFKMRTPGDGQQPAASGVALAANKQQQAPANDTDQRAEQDSIASSVNLRQSLSNIIQELPYISGLVSITYTM